MPDNKRVNNVIRKKLFKHFKDLNFKITVEMNVKIVQYLDVEFNLLTGTVSTYMKSNSVKICKL